MKKIYYWTYQGWDFEASDLLEARQQVENYINKTLDEAQDGTGIVRRMTANKSRGYDVEISVRLIRNTEYDEDLNEGEEAPSMGEV